MFNSLKTGGEIYNKKTQRAFFFLRVRRNNDESYNVARPSPLQTDSGRDDSSILDDDIVVKSIDSGPRQCHFAVGGFLQFI
jgi:hypothetical protein